MATEVAGQLSVLSSSKCQIYSGGELPLQAVGQGRGQGSQEGENAGSRSLHAVCEPWYWEGPLWCPIALQGKVCFQAQQCLLFFQGALDREEALKLADF